MRQLVECVPNFSEGRDQTVISDIASAIESVDRVTLLDVDPGRDTNRTVMTFVGEPGPVVEAAFQAVSRAAALIDMSSHKGAHPRMGATDVCPFIPIEGMTREACIPLAEALAKRVFGELGIPVYLYGAAARKEERVRLPDIRKGEYEALEEKLRNPSFAPDYGEAVFNPRSGATVIGVRDFLLAYNVNLSVRDARIAKEIGLIVREIGRKKRDEHGRLVRDGDGRPARVPGLLTKCQAGGWYIEEYGQAQVTMNLLDFHETGLHDAFETVSREAEKLGARVTGSEVVGMLPKQAVLDAGAFYLEKAGKCAGVPEPDLVHSAVLGLGLNDISRFEPDEKIIEYAIEKKVSTLRKLSLSAFTDELSSDSPAPGGGSISALSGALSAGLASMVANLTFQSKAHADVRDEMASVARSAQALKDRLLVLLDADSEAFNAYLAAKRLPQKKEKDRRLRKAALLQAAKEMTLVPLETLRLTRDLVTLAETAAAKGLKAALSDAAVAAVQAGAAAVGAHLNVTINLPMVDDDDFVTETADESQAILAEVERAVQSLVIASRKALEP